MIDAQDSTANWFGDPHLGSVLHGMFSSNPFTKLPVDVRAADAADPKTMFEALYRLLHTNQAKQLFGVVAIWAVEQPFLLRSGASTTIVYVEKTDDSLCYRWPKRYITCLVTNEGSDPRIPSEPTIHDFAKHDWNWTFYSQLVTKHGPLCIWISTVEQLNATCEQKFTTARDWERFLLNEYQKAFGCLPPKNRRG